MERDRSGAMRLRVAEQNTSSITEIAYCLPLRLINSQSHGLFEAGPIGRRQYVDWGLFYQMTGFFDCWQHFGRTLKQRNAVLRDKRSKQELNVWTDKFVYYGCQLDQWRKEYIGQLIPILQSMVMELLDLTPLDVTYQSGWDSNMDLGTALARCYLEECRLGYTQSGPHRADLDVKIQGTPVKHRLSRGQQKLLVCAMILAQGVLLTHTVNKHLVYLIDDLPAELDKESTQRLVTLLSKQSTQVFMTAIESEVIRESLYSNIHIPVKVFHVKQGEIVTAGG
jgi:DNA replication and repair protein RecF